MARTAAEIRDRAGEELGIKQIGQSMQSQDAARLNDAYEEVYARLKHEGLATWAVAGSVPDEVAQYVIYMTAHNAIVTFGISDSRASRILAHTGGNDDLALREIRKYIAPAYVSQDEPVDY